MASPDVDKALKRVVAELATARPEDVQAILQELDPTQRQTVLGLLTAYSGAGEDLTAEVQSEGDWDIPAIDGLSNWLAQRLSMPAVAVSDERPLRNSGAEDSGARMTAGAVDALRACTTHLLANGNLRPAVARKAARGWRERIIRRPAAKLALP